MDEPESSIKHKFTKTHYISLFCLPAAPSANSETKDDNKQKLIDKDSLKVNLYQQTVKKGKEKCVLMYCWL